MGQPIDVEQLDGKEDYITNKAIQLIHTGFISHINRSLNGCRKTLNEVLYGMTSYELELELKIVPLYKT
jgi:hypothetical protein